MGEPAIRQLGISEARANMTEVIAEVRLLGRPVVLTRRDKPQAVLVSVADYEQAKALRRLAQMVKAADPDLYEELLAKATLKPRTVRVTKRKPSTD
ncbi:type II toxin-antitoxin system Phd/YefM family antitoxin [Streptomyces sp. NPDC019443]|uniref:type II toxin-antitoxin system Phd/YefM family antitoxin n=1 Tax=Streptomyces sp. NPDC019443 TaxID=3365061 RepID=UPI0037A4F5A9